MGGDGKKSLGALYIECMFDCSQWLVIVENGLRWVWDYRQEISSAENFRVFLRESLTLEQREEVLKKFSSRAAEVIDELKSPGFFAQELARFYGFPSRKLKLIGVTGTNGKTSTVTLITYMLTQLGFKTLAIGTLGLTSFKSSGVLESNGETGFTSPDLPILNSILSQAVEKGFDFVVMEVSSHALSLGRVDCVDFDEGIFLNLDRDHLDFHKTIENYAAAKELLFSNVLLKSSSNKKTLSIFNGDDKYGKLWNQKYQELFSVKEFSLGANYKVLREDLSGLEIETNNVIFKVPLLGGFNAENVMAAVSAVESWAKLPNSVLEKFPGIPGRMELVKNGNKYFYVDYAHKPLALEKALSILKSLKLENQKLWCVFGCGGNRDPGKRPIMGEIAARIADRVIVTSDNPRKENPHDIISQIISGVEESKRPRIQAIESRAFAIETAFRHMSENDICLVAGKGPENYQIIGETKIFFDDREVIKSLTNN